jgi:hypothetical protein
VFCVVCHLGKKPHFSSASPSGRQQQLPMHRISLPLGQSSTTWKETVWEIPASSKAENRNLTSQAAEGSMHRKAGMAGEGVQQAMDWYMSSCEHGITFG